MKPSLLTLLDMLAIHNGSMYYFELPLWVNCETKKPKHSRVITYIYVNNKASFEVLSIFIRRAAILLFWTGIPKVAHSHDLKPLIRWDFNLDQTSAYDV